MSRNWTAVFWATVVTLIWVAVLIALWPDRWAYVVAGAAVGWAVGNGLGWLAFGRRADL